MSRGNQSTLTNGESGLAFRTALNNMFGDLYGPSMSLQPTVWVDPNRVDSYTADGSIQFPYKSLGALCTALAASTLPGLNIQFTSTTASAEGSLVTLPSTILGPIAIRGAGGTITFNAGFTIPSGLAAGVSITGLNIVVPTGQTFTQGQTSLAYRNIFEGGSISGVFTINGAVEARGQAFSGGVITVAATGSFTASAGCTFVSGGVNTSQITSAGALVITGSRITYAGPQFSVVSTAGTANVANTYINNGNSTSSAGCLDFHLNGATLAAPNFLSDVQALCGYTAGAVVNIGSTVTYISKLVTNTTVFPTWSGTGGLPASDLVSTGTASNAGSSLFYNAFNITLQATASTNIILPVSGYIPSSTAANTLSFVTSGTTNPTLPASSGYILVSGAANQVVAVTAPAATTTLNLANSGTQTVLTTAAATGTFTPADPTGTTNTTGLMMGLGSTASFTPVQTGRVLITISGQMANGTINDGVKVSLYFGTGSAPANAAAITGTVRGALQTATSLVAAQRSGFSISAVATGLTLATAIWVDAAVAAVTGGTASIFGVTITVIEV